MVAMVDGMKHSAEVKRQPDGWTTHFCKCGKRFSDVSQDKASIKWLEHCRRVGFKV